MSEKPLEILGSRVRERRHELGLSQTQLAVIAGLHWTFIGQVERGTRNLSFTNLLRVADALQVDAADLVQGLHSPGERR